MSRTKQENEKTTDLYCRISLDDGGDNESMSISNQKSCFGTLQRKMECFSMSIMWMMATQVAISIALFFSV